MQVEQLDSIVLDGMPRVFPIVWQQMKRWVKQGKKQYANPLLWLGGAVAGDPLVREVKRLGSLRSAGCLVPQLLEHNDRYIVLSDMGYSLQHYMRAARDDAARHGYAEVAAMGLKKMHTAGEWHGSPVLRNVTLQRMELGYIDLENSLRSLLPRWLGQSVDLWQMGHSFARYDDRGLLSASFFALYGACPARKRLQIAAWLLAPLCVVMFPFRRRFKREIWQSVAAVRGLLSCQVPSIKKAAFAAQQI